MIVQVELEGKKGLVKESDNLVDALKEFNPKRVKSVTHTEGYTLKVTGKYNNRTGEFEYV